MRYGYAVLFVLIMILLSGCAGSRSTVSNRSVDYNSYDEDLTAIRPVYVPAPVTGVRPVPPATVPVTTPSRSVARPAEALHVNHQLDLIVDTIAVKNLTVRYAPGYRIQVYVGNKREEVEAIKLLIYKKFPELSPYLSYNQPTYKLKVGDFMRRLDAEQYYTHIHQLIVSAQLQPDKINIRRSLIIK